MPKVASMLSYYVDKKKDPDAWY